MPSIFVSPLGNDSWSGRGPELDGADGPFATLEAARDAARKIIAARPSEPVEIQLRAGTYYRDRPLVLGPKDSGTADCPVTWRNFPGEAPVLSAARPIAGWKKPRTFPEGLPELARDQLWVAELPELKGGWRFSCLFDSEGMLARAATLPLHTVPDKEPPDASTLFFHPGDLRNWPNLQDVELFIIPRHVWTVNYLPLESVDVAAGVARTTLPATYALATHGGWNVIDTFYRVENVPEGLSEPGRWMIDSTRGLLYLWPRKSGEPQNILAPTGIELIRVEGDLDHRQWACHITIRGLTFAHGDRMRWGPDRVSLQHDWEQYDFPNAMLRLRGVENITVEHCRFVHSGSSGIRLDLHAMDNRVRRNEIDRIGGSGITLAGYGPGNRDEHRRNEITGNHIHHSALLWWHSPGVFVSQSGDNLICDNLIHHLPYAGIIVSGPRSHLFQDPLHIEGGATIRFNELGESPLQWHDLLACLYSSFNVIEHNEIHNVMERLGDGNGIYLSGTGPGNIVRRNFVHDLLGLGTHSGIRTDDSQYFSRITENVVARCNGGGITVKLINVYDNNILVDCRRFGCILFRIPPSGPAFGSTISRNILVQFQTELQSAPEMYCPFYDGGGAGYGCTQPIVNANILFCPGKPEVAETVLQRMRSIGKDTDSIAADPKFVDLDADDFHLQPDSPALGLGFKPIDSWGLSGPVGPDSPAPAMP